jgi:hypothetical protein
MNSNLPAAAATVLFWDFSFCAGEKILRICSSSITASLLRSDSWLISFFLLIFGLYELFAETLGAGVFCSDINKDMILWRFGGTILRLMRIYDTFLLLLVKSICVC